MSRAEEPSDLVKGTDSPAAPIACSARGFVDARGREWIARDPVYDDAPEIEGRVDGAVQGKRPDEMSVEELAVAMMPVVLWSDCEFTLAEPDIELAQEAIDNRGIEQRFPGYRGDAPSEREVDEMGAVDRFIFGADNREDRRDNTSYPMRTQVYIETSGASGSATLIGRSTAIGAAHVVHTGFGWKSSIRWSPGADSRDSVEFPYKPGSSYPTTDTSNDTRPCKLIAVPGGWVGTLDSDWDFSVFEFDVDVAGTAGCNEQPGQIVGWLAWGFVNEANTDGEHGYLYGYPGESSGDGSCGDAYIGCGGSTCWPPTIWGWGNTTLDATAYHKLECTIDATPGQSGAGVYIKESDGTRRVIATFTGCQSPFIGADYNRGRRLDSDFISFIRAYSAL